MTFLLKNSLGLVLVFLMSSVGFSEVLFDQSFLDSMLKEYSVAEKKLIQEDLKNISELVFRDLSPSQGPKPVYLATAGAPGAHKSTILETLLHKDPRFANLAYIDPDARALRFMINSYYSQSLNFYEISKASNFQTAARKAYEHWRAASNYIANTLLERALNSGFQIAHGTTLTGDKVPTLLSKVKAKNYSPILVLCHAPDDVRMQAIEHRAKDQAFYQTSPEDVREKGKLFLQRLPTYFDFADEILVYWTNKLFHSVQAASIRDSKLTILDKAAYAQFIRYLNAQQGSSSYWQDLLKSKKIEVQTR